MHPQTTWMSGGFIIMDSFTLTFLTAKDLVRHNKVKVDSDSTHSKTYDVDGHKVRIFNKKSQKLINCTCRDGDFGVNSPSICYHKISAILFESEKPLKVKFDKIYEFYNNAHKLGLKVEPWAFLDDLETLRKLI